MSSNITDDETETAPIVLRAPAGFATVADPTDPDGERVIELPAAEEGADTTGINALRNRSAIWGHRGRGTMPHLQHG